MRHSVWVGVLALGLFAACNGSTDSDGASGGSGGAATGGAAGAVGGSGGATGGTGGATGGTSSGGVAGMDASPGGSAGTDSGTPIACVDGGAVDGGTEAAIVASCIVAVIKVVRIDEECSGAGGSHITFDVVEIGRGSGITKVSYGDHAYYPPPDGPDKVGDVFVAGIDGLGQLVAPPDNPGWCLVGLPAVDGIVHTYLAAANETEASAKMKQLLGL
jgi:hypothetical protein